MKKLKQIPFVKQAVFGFGALGVAIGAHAAATFVPNDQPPGYLAPMTMNVDCLMVNCLMASGVTNTSGGGKAYRPWFENGAWQGDLVEYSVAADGSITTTIDLSVNPPVSVGSPANWSARMLFDKKANPAFGGSLTWWSTGRKIITANGASQKAFLWSDLSVAQKTALDSVSQLGAKATSPVLDYVRGDASKEVKNAGTYRDRFNLLGDIQHSTPVYVGAPSDSYNFGSYDAFKTANATRAVRIYEGANDGMLHAFDAATGEEVYAYIPSLLMGNLSKLAKDPYAHTYFVDGPMTAADAQISGTWKTVLVGGLGAGGKGLFALDITNPTLSDEKVNTGTDNKLLWEIDATADGDLGYTYSKPVIARLNDGKWYAIMGNGYNSVNGQAVLYIIDLADKTAIKRIGVGTATPATPNGLSSPTLVDSNGDFKVDYAYAGDIDGKMWKFDLSGNSTGSWVASYSGTPLYTATDSDGNAQSITTAPDVVDFKVGYLVYFGTGQAFTVPSLTNTNTQSIYAIYDNGLTPGTPSLVSQTMTEVTYVNTAPKTNETVRWITNNTINWATNTGWKIDLPGGERLLTNPGIRAERMQFVSTNPAIGDNPTAWLIEPNYLTGGSPTKTVFDLNADGILGTADNYDANGNGVLTDAGDKVVGWKVGTGLVSQPVFAIIEVLANSQGTIDTLFINNLILPYIETCTGDCVGGFVGGHMDVDTDSPMGGVITNSNSNKSGDTDPNYSLGYLTDGHRHEYDKDMGVVYADYFNLEPRRGKISLKDGSTVTQKLNRVKEVKKPDGSAPPFAGSQEFIVVLANADLSPGGTLTIGSKEWPVVDYQKMVTDKLVALGATRATSLNFTDNEGKSLVFTLDGIQAGGGTLRISFDNKSIISGGLHPTVTGCVKGDKLPYDSTGVSTDYNKHITIVPNGASKDPSATTGYRWRNGALTIQVLDRLTYTLQDSSFLPKDKDGILVGGMHAKMYSATNDVDIKKSTTSGFTIAKGASESGLLFESTLFWHYGDLYKLRTAKEAPCFGSSTWQASVNIERNGLTLGEYNALLGGLTDTSDKIVNYVAALTALNDYIESEAGDETVIKALVDALNAAIVPIKDYVKYRQYAGLGLVPDAKLLNIDIQSSTTGVPLVGKPAAVTGAPETPGDTVGPNYTPGRRTWTEITPKT